jgi:rRNA maturation endonuclease Nob1
MALVLPSVSLSEEKAPQFTDAYLVSKAKEEALDSYKKVLTAEEYKSVSIIVDKSSIKRIGEVRYKVRGTMKLPGKESRGWECCMEWFVDREFGGKMLVIYVVSTD